MRQLSAYHVTYSLSHQPYFGFFVPEAVRLLLVVGERLLEIDPLGCDLVAVRLDVDGPLDRLLVSVLLLDMVGVLVGTRVLVPVRGPVTEGLALRLPLAVEAAVIDCGIDPVTELDGVAVPVPVELGADDDV